MMQKKFSLSDDDDSNNDSELPEPQLELTGFDRPGWFEQAVHSGLNVIGSITGKKKSPAPPPLAAPFGPDQQQSSVKSSNAYKPTWKGDNFRPNIEHINITGAIGEFNKQKSEMQRQRGTAPLIFRRPATSMPFIYKFTIFLVIVMLVGGTTIYLDQKFNIRQLAKQLKDPGRVKKSKIRKPVIEE